MIANLKIKSFVILPVLNTGLKAMGNLEMKLFCL